MLKQSGGRPQPLRPLFEWLDRLIAAFAESRWLAGEMQGAVERLAQEGRELSESINMRFLYDPCAGSSRSATTSPKAAGTAPTTISLRVRRGSAVSSPSPGATSPSTIGSR